MTGTHRPDTRRVGSRCRVDCSCGWRGPLVSTFGEASIVAIWPLRCHVFVTVSWLSVGTVSSGASPWSRAVTPLVQGVRHERRWLSEK